jgi:hypothetical protein|tara:strand:- start:370 stop:597 length:228 start_codon:yes stop_codon:yes gene_type:complete
MSNWLEGEYVHVPSGTTVYQLDPEGSVKSFKHISQPVALMFLGEAELSPYYRVFYLGGTYLIDRQHVYKLGEEND